MFFVCVSAAYELCYLWCHVNSLYCMLFCPKPHNLEKSKRLCSLIIIFFFSDLNHHEFVLYIIFVTIYRHSMHCYMPILYPWLIVIIWQIISWEASVFVFYSNVLWAFQEQHFDLDSQLKKIKLLVNLTCKFLYWLLWIIHFLQRNCWWVIRILKGV